MGVMGLDNWTNKLEVLDSDMVNAESQRFKLLAVHLGIIFA
jgi:hypothetical protein